ncbi:MAG: hypothetical protein ACD_29C00046G0003 [uncultured bacterium]|nr:MAG: hypothetical protein ACD_29C00046G0003 [uncultured bacterium]
MIATPIAVLPLLFSESWLISLFQQDRQVAAIAGDFLRKISNIIPAEFISFFSMQFLLANGNTKILFLGSVILILNLLFSILLSFGLFGFPEYKMNGIVMSYSVSAWLTALLYTGALFFHADFRDLALLKHVFQSLKGKKAELIDFMKAALVPTITILTDFGIPFLLTTLSIQFGVTSQAALALTMQCLALNNLLNISFAIASVIIFGRKIGEKFKDIFTFGITINLVSTIVELILPLIVAIRSDLIIDLITKECSVAVRQSVAKLAPLIAIQNWLSGLTTSLLFQTRALNRGMFSAMTYAGCMTLGLAVACILAFAMEMKIEGIAIGYLSSTALSLIALLLTWRDSMNHSSNHACCFWFWKKNPNPQELADLAEPILGS